MYIYIYIFRDYTYFTMLNKKLPCPTIPYNISKMKRDR